jgi:hypothetical protein
MTQLLLDYIDAATGSLAFIPLTTDHAYYAVLMAIGSLIVWRVR